MQVWSHKRVLSLGRNKAANGTCVTIDCAKASATRHGGVEASCGSIWFE